MESFILEILNLVIRWLHLITGIAWIGASFYFIWLDNSLEEPPQWKKDKGIKGDLWSFHGGGIYEVAKYQTGPEKMPKTLHWFYWEAYATWITGMCLMFVIYYLQAPTYLVLPGGWISSPALTILASVIFIGSGVLSYECLIRTGVANKPMLFATVMFVLLTGFSWLATYLFAARAAYLHMGVLIGTMMVANVFIGIIPPQRAFARSVEEGTEPPVKALLGAKLRSTHNNYFTLPVLFCMISNHYPFLYGHRYSWLILMAIFAITAASRLYFNLAHKGEKKPAILIVCAVLFILLCCALAWDKIQQDQALSKTHVSTELGLKIVEKHCAVCHAPSPSFPGFSAPPLGMNLTTAKEFELVAEKALVAVSTNYMPLGNVTSMTAEERDQLIAWMRSLTISSGSSNSGE